MKRISPASTRQRGRMTPHHMHVDHHLRQFGA